MCTRGEACLCRCLKPSSRLGKSCRFLSPSDINSLLMFFKVVISFHFKYIFFSLIISITICVMASIHFKALYYMSFPYPNCITSSLISSLYIIKNEIISSLLQKPSLFEPDISTPRWQLYVSRGAWWKKTQGTFKRHYSKLWVVWMETLPISKCPKAGVCLLQSASSELPKANFSCQILRPFCWVHANET